MIEQIDFGRSAPALFVEAEGASVSYLDLGERITGIRAQVHRHAAGQLVFLFAANSVSWVATYLACLTAKIPLGLGEAAVASRNRVIATYQPGAVLLAFGDAAGPDGYVAAETIAGGELVLWRRVAAASQVVFHPDLALLLATSGSTGDAKLVRLALRNVAANARSIADYLALGPSEIAVQSLPLHYSYGLSVLNSHLVAGASVVLTRHSFMRPEFWQTARARGCTSFAGVPYMYETMQRLRIDPTAGSAVRTLTQAGGHLAPAVVQHFNELARAGGARFFVMYGQTEATARISYVPAERLAARPGTIGIAIPGGELALRPVADQPGANELIYRGANVMLGYATNRADLARGDELGGELATGDLAECEADGFFRLVGRLGRVAKLFGKRVNLAGIETEIEAQWQCRAAVVAGENKLRIFLEGSGEVAPEALRSHLAAWLGVPPPTFQFTWREKLPLTASGKKDYNALA
ncbi:MAG: AMP-binding protein [Candidatus Didemnitutus sp.]|nr:AMP-binding protein [Candidatus Didemnitutus sp.]